MNKVTVDVSQGSRGNQRANALLVGKATASWTPSSDSTTAAPKLGTMCCLGFAALEMKWLEDVAFPASLERLIPKLTELHGGALYNSDFSVQAAQINDDRNISDQERMEKLTDIGRDHGIEFEFVGAERTE